MRPGSTSKSQRASMTSSPLFIKVAESMVILAPMVQLGWRSASAGVTADIRSAGRWRSGPPEAVRMRRRTSSRLWPASDWKMALCSLSTGRMVTPRSAARRITSSPASTSDSLLASPTGLPASTAAAVERSPAPPEMAASTKSASESVATATAPASPWRISGASRPSISRSVPAAAASETETRSGRTARTCSASRSTLRPAASPTTAKRPGWRAATSRAWTPIEPVEPRMESRFIARATSRRPPPREPRRGRRRSDRGALRGPG